MSVRLKLSTKTLYEPIEVEIDGEVLRVKPITLGDLERIQDLQEKAGAGSATAIRKSLEALLEGKVAILKSLPLGALAELVEFVVTKSVKPATEEKNGQGPGDKSLPS